MCVMYVFVVYVYRVVYELCVACNIHRLYCVYMLCVYVCVCVCVCRVSCVLFILSVPNVLNMLRCVCVCVCVCVRVLCLVCVCV